VATFAKRSHATSTDDTPRATQAGGRGDVWETFFWVPRFI